jgi:hypothetical protein
MENIMYFKGDQVAIKIHLFTTMLEIVNRNNVLFDYNYEKSQARYIILLKMHYVYE